MIHFFNIFSIPFFYYYYLSTFVLSTDFMDLVYQSFLAFMVFAEAIAVSKGSADGLLLIARTPLILACLHNGQYPFFFPITMGVYGVELYDLRQTTPLRTFSCIGIWNHTQPSSRFCCFLVRATWTYILNIDTTMHWWLLGMLCQGKPLSNQGQI